MNAASVRQIALIQLGRGRRNCFLVLKQTTKLTGLSLNRSPIHEIHPSCISFQRRPGQRALSESGPKGPSTDHNKLSDACRLSNTQPVRISLVYSILGIDLQSSLILLFLLLCSAKFQKIVFRYTYRYTMP